MIKSTDKLRFFADHNLGVILPKTGGACPRSSVPSAVTSGYQRAADLGLDDAQSDLRARVPLRVKACRRIMSAHNVTFCAAPGYKDALREIDRLTRSMTPSQIAEADKLGRQSGSELSKTDGNAWETQARDVICAEPWLRDNQAKAIARRLIAAVSGASVASILSVPQSSN